jgi:hypothetical protein
MGRSSEIRSASCSFCYEIYFASRPSFFFDSCWFSILVITHIVIMLCCPVNPPCWNHCFFSLLLTFARRTRGINLTCFDPKPGLVVWLNASKKRLNAEVAFPTVSSLLAFFSVFSFSWGSSSVTKRGRFDDRRITRAGLEPAEKGDSMIAMSRGQIKTGHKAGN